MNTTILTFTLVKNGAPYDATSVTLQSPAGVSPAYGLKRIDTNAIVIPGPTAVSIVNSGTTATVTQAGHGFSTGQDVQISGASLAANNGTFPITVIDANTYTYTMTSSPGANPTGATATAAFTHVSTGVYSFTFADPAAGLTYDYWRQVVVDGQTLYEEVQHTVSVGSYFTQSGIEAIYGANNVVKWSNKEGDSLTADQNAINAAGLRAEREVERRMRELQYLTPLASTSKDLGVMGDIVNELAGVYLYQGRGEATEEDAKGLAGKMSRHLEHALSMLDQLLYAGLDCPRTIGYTDAPQSVSATVDPSGNPVASTSPYPRLVWDGFWWVPAT